MAELRATIAELEAILGDEAVLMRRHQGRAERGQATEFATPRRSKITYDPGDMDIEDLIDDEDLVVTMSAKGYVKTVASDAFRTQGRGGRGVAGAKLRDEDYITHIITTTAHAYLLFFSNLGRVYRLKAHEIPMKERTARGTAIVNLLPLQPDEHIQAIIDTRDYETNRYLFFATKKGQVKKTKFTEYDSSLRAGLIAINLRDGDELVRVIPSNDGDDIFMVSRTRHDHPLRRGRGAAHGPHGGRRAGHEAQGSADDEVVSCDVARDDATILLVTDAGYGKRTQLDHFTRKGRGGQGVRGIKLTARRGRVVAAFMVDLDDEIFVIASGGTVIRMPVREISSQGRDATGVRVMNLDDGQTVAAVAPVLPARRRRRAPADPTALPLVTTTRRGVRARRYARWSVDDTGTGHADRRGGGGARGGRRARPWPRAGGGRGRRRPGPHRGRRGRAGRRGRGPRPRPAALAGPTAAALVDYARARHRRRWCTVRVGSRDRRRPERAETGVGSPRPLTAEAGRSVPYTRGDAPRALRPRWHRRGTVPGTWRRDALTADPATRPAPVVTPRRAGSRADRRARAAARPPRHEPAGRTGRRRGRRVKRIVRRIELWSVLKLALIFFLCMYVVVAGHAGRPRGASPTRPGWSTTSRASPTTSGWENWQFDGEQMFRQAAVIGAVLVVAGHPAHACSPPPCST